MLLMRAVTQHSALSTQHSQRGQFLPMTALALFTAMVGMVALLRLHEVAREKVKIQGLADAVSLAVATWEANELNVITDRNEWLNHMYKPGSDWVADWQTKLGQMKNAHQWLQNQVITQNATMQPPAQAKILQWYVPPISVADYRQRSGYIFDSLQSAQAYARLVRAVNQIQDQFKQIYKQRIENPGPYLREEVEELKEGQPYWWNVWNVGSHPRELDQAAKDQILRQPQGGLLSGSAYNRRQNLEFQPVDVKIRYLGPGTLINNQPPSFQFPIRPAQTLGQALQPGGSSSAPTLGGNPRVGYMALDVSSSRLPEVGSGHDSGQPSSGIGANSIVVRPLSLPMPGLGSLDILLEARSQARVAKSGRLPTTDHLQPGDPPIFRPTFWAQLVNP